MSKKKKKSKKKSPTPPPRKPPEHAPGTPLANPTHEALAHLLQGGLSKVDAATKLGRHYSTIKAMAYRPDVQARILELGKEMAAQVVAARVEKQVRDVTVDRNDIIMGLADMAGLTMGRNGAESERAKVAALIGLSDIFMLRARSLKEVKKFYGWTATELDEYGRTGVVPARIRQILGEGENPSLDDGESLRGEKGGSA